MSIGWVMLKALLLIGVLLIAYAYLVRFERRVLGHLALGGRSPWGPLWPLVDTIRALGKAPLWSGSHPVAYRCAPLLTLITQVLAIALLPLGPNPTNPQGAMLDFARLDYGLPAAYLCQWAGLVGLLIGAHALGHTGMQQKALQHVRRDLAYGLAGLVGLAGSCMLTTSYSLHNIVAAQENAWPLAVYQPLGMLIVAVSSVAMGRRVPAMPLRGHDRFADFHVQHMGNPMALFHWADYCRLLLFGGLISTVYLGGWHGPWVDGPHWLATKSVLVVIALLWIRHKWLIPHRDRIDRLGWRVLMLLGTANTLITATLTIWRG